MKINLIQILILLSFFSCETKKDKIQKTWIGKYEVFHSGSEDEWISETALRKIIEFDKDSLLIKPFHFNFIDDDNEQISMAYEIVGNQILTIQDTFNIQNIFTDSLIISFDSRHSKRIIYEELIRYNQADREKELLELLTSNTFTTQEDSIIIEFRENGKFVSRSFNFGEGSNQFWMIDKFENELFLVFDGFLGAAIQIQDFNSKKILGKIYYKENIDVIWNKLENEIGFEISEIMGEWEQTETSTLPPPIDNDEEYFEKELLKISKDKILKYEGFRIDTLNWELNRGKSIMIFNLDFSVKRRIGKQWNIMSIENDTLTLERKRRRIGELNSNIITSKFKRKK